jgi:hypothetical protein
MKNFSKDAEEEEYAETPNNSMRNHQFKQEEDADDVDDAIGMEMDEEEDRKRDQLLQVHPPPPPSHRAHSE